MKSQTSSFAPDWLAQRARLSPRRTALEDADGGARLTYLEWNARVNQCAYFLRSLGVSVGDRVSVYSNNRREYLDILFACGKLGAILHNLNWRLTAKDLCYCEVETLSEILESRPELPLDHPFGIYYTGGTTGLPKGATLSHGNLLWNAIHTVSSWGITSGHSALLQLPLFHIGGRTSSCCPWCWPAGGRSCVVPLKWSRPFAGSRRARGLPLLCVSVRQRDWLEPRGA